jgi:hypothetical protein
LFQRFDLPSQASPSGGGGNIRMWNINKDDSLRIK